MDRGGRGREAAKKPHESAKDEGGKKNGASTCRSRLNSIAHRSRVSRWIKTQRDCNVSTIIETVMKRNFTVTDTIITILIKILGKWLPKLSKKEEKKN